MSDPLFHRQPYKAALVTGGAKRIGAVIVRHLASRGMKVVLHYQHSAEEAEALVEELKRKKIEIIALQADLTKSHEAKNLIKDATKALGQPIDCLINNASLFEKDSLDDCEDDLFDRHYAIHVKAPAYLAQAMLKQLPEGRKGLIVNMIDQKILKLNPHFFTYTLSKAALGTLTKTAAQALAPYIRVNGIAPGPTLASKHQDEEAFEAEAEKATLLGHSVDVDDITRALDFLMASQSVTGQILALDSGQHLA